ncbi:NAD kinase [Thermophagus xiamenensis]|uniref:NAD kinase n=1 Tax=Thermophagus xiamenensis TaxID=385682 RepID=A0A1I1XR28_9BACT|nr:NAD kinase [Thermophagus xiamenensis]SFE09779.1 NAD+ kinase [Thermophagus xiamenensis]
MKIAIFGKSFGEVFYNNCHQLFDYLHQKSIKIYIYKPFYDFLFEKVNLKPEVKGFFSSPYELPMVDMVFSIGGDGTFLQAVTFVRDTGIPVVGINSGRLGFLADISRHELPAALYEIEKGLFEVKKLTLLELTSPKKLIGDFNFALNELAVHKQDSSSMITIHVYLNDQFLNSYWADGLIVSTPTGSTAYSLSVGGPIMHPASQSIIITPIAPHNLTVRPLVIPDDMELTLKVEGRGGKFLASLDSRSVVVDQSTELKIKKADFTINIVERTNQSFYSTLRNKLMWGADKRN